MVLQENPDFYELVFRLGGKPTVQAQFFVGFSQFESNPTSTQDSVVQCLIAENAANYQKPLADLPVDFFNYQTAMQKWNITYIAVRGADSVKRFCSDQSFSLVFMNNDVAIFRVNRFALANANLS